MYGIFIYLHLVDLYGECRQMYQSDGSYQIQIIHRSVLNIKLLLATQLAHHSILRRDEAIFTLALPMTARSNLRKRNCEIIGRKIVMYQHNNDKTSHVEQFIG